MTDIGDLINNPPAISPTDLANRLDVTTQTVYNWIGKRNNGPPYLIDAILAAKHGYKPAPISLTHSFYKQLGITRQHVHGWKLNNVTPLPARMATRWILTR